MRITRTSIPWIVACVVAVIVVALLVRSSRSTIARAAQASGADVAPGPALRQPPSSPPEPITATALDEAYEANAATADRRFKGKDIDVVGTIVDVGKDALGAPYVKLGTHPGSQVGVQALFHRDAEHPVAALANGDSVTLHCKVRGKVIDIVLDDCERN